MVYHQILKGKGMMKTGINKLQLLMLVLSMFFVLDGAFAGFYDHAKRGWFWFEGKDIDTQQKQEDDQISAEEAKAIAESITKELDDLRYVMFARPTVENVRNYREKEKVLMQKSEELYDVWEQSNFLYPHLNDKLVEPTNVHAVKLDRQIKKDQQSKNIKEFMQNYDLILFRSGECKHCQAFEPVLKSFADKYAIKVEAVSLDDSLSMYFENKSAKQLVKALNIDAYPVVIAVHKHNLEMFELIRGFVTIDELEEYVMLAKIYATQKSKTQ